MKHSRVIEMEITNSYASARYPSGIWKREKHTEITFWRRWDERFPRVRMIKYANPTSASLERVHRAIMAVPE